MTSQQAASPATRAGGLTRGRAGLLVGAVGFVVLYLCTDFVAPNLASSTLPLPNAPVAEAREWFASNQLAAVAMGVTQFLSVTFLALFVTRIGRVTARAGQAPAARATPWGLAAVALMMLASVLAWLLAALAPGASLGVVSVLRTANFIAGGTAHVLALGLYVLLVSRIPGMTKPVRVLGYVAAVPSVLSVLSLVWFQGAALILLGRLLCMIWTISAAVSLTRSLSRA